MSCVDGAPPSAQRTRVLFFGEAATLAHVARPSLLAKALDPTRYAVALATGPDFAQVAVELGVDVLPLACIGTKAYLRAVASGSPVFPFSVLDAYVREDLKHIRQFEPDVVVGDFRLSLSVSARMARVPYIAISNAYWSPRAHARFEVPVHSLTRVFGVTVSNAVFSLLRPAIFALHSLPMHRLRKKYGVPTAGLDLRGVFTNGDFTAFADVPELVPLGAPKGGSTKDSYIGPVVWSPATPLPSQILESNERPLVYVAMGSSGDRAVLADVVDASLATGCRVAVATSGAKVAPADYLIQADMMPGEELARRSRLVICNGGSPSTHQALSMGTPVLGIASNLDQLLNMHFVTAAGAGLLLRADQTSRESVNRAVSLMLSEDSFARQARQIASWFQGYSYRERFDAIVQAALREGGTGQV